MVRPRDPLLVRRDAVRIGVQKLAAGCDLCAQGYFELARQNGATEEDIQFAITQWSKEPEISRRTMLRVAAATSAGLAATVASESLFGEVAHAQAAPSSNPQGVAWLVGSAIAPPTAGSFHMASPAGPVFLAGVDASGRIVGHIDAVLFTIRRTPDGSQFYLAWPRWDGAASATTVELYSAASGVHEQTIVGRTVAKGNATELWDGIADRAVSSDSRYVALVHHIHQVSGDPGTKERPNMAYRDIVTIGVELLDLKAARSLSYLQIGTTDAQAVGGDSIYFSPDGTHLYLFSRRFNGHFEDSVIVLGFDGNTLQLQTRAGNGEGGHTVPFRPAPTRSPGHGSGGARISPDGQTLVSCSVPIVQWFNLRQLTLVRELPVPVNFSGYAKFPPVPLPVFAPDVSTLYLASPGDGSVRAIDVQQGMIRTQISLPPPGAPASIAPNHPNTHSLPGNPTPWERSDRLSPQGAAIAADGTKLYMIENRSGGNGLWVLHLPSLQIAAHWLVGHPLSAVWPSPDNTAVYALSKAEDRLYVLTPAGDLVTQLPAGGAYSFATPEAV